MIPIPVLNETDLAVRALELSQLQTGPAPSGVPPLSGVLAQMKKIKLAALAAILALLPGLSQAEFFSGNNLLERLRDPAKRATAMGYLAGVHDVGEGSEHCSSDAITLGQLADMVERSLTNFPEKRHLSADIFVRATLSTAWPCKQKNSGKGL